MNVKARVLEYSGISRRGGPIKKWPGINIHWSDESEDIGVKSLKSNLSNFQFLSQQSS